jgi:serine/threonine protein kinase
VELSKAAHSFDLPEKSPPTLAAAGGAPKSSPNDISQCAAAPVPLHGALVVCNVYVFLKYPRRTTHVRIGEMPVHSAHNALPFDTGYSNAAVNANRMEHSHPLCSHRKRNIAIPRAPPRQRSVIRCAKRGRRTRCGSRDGAAASTGRSARNDIVHRDLKPANVFLHRDETMQDDEFIVKVLDFGVSKLLDAESGPATVTGMPIGSPAYMSPEQISASKDIDTRTDLWSLGILLHELVVGVRPFGGTVEDVVRQILIVPAARMSTRVRNIPAAFDELVARCLERDRDKRVQSAEEVARILDELAKPIVATNSNAASTDADRQSPAAPDNRNADVLPPALLALAPGVTQTNHVASVTQGLPFSTSDAPNELPFHGVSLEEHTAKVPQDASRMAEDDDMIVVARPHRTPHLRREQRLVKGSLALGVAAVGVSCFVALSNVRVSEVSRSHAPFAMASAQEPLVGTDTEPEATSTAEAAPLPLPSSSMDDSTIATGDSPASSAILPTEPKRPAPKKVFVIPR